MFGTWKTSPNCNAQSQYNVPSHWWHWFVRCGLQWAAFLATQNVLRYDARAVKPDFCRACVHVLYISLLRHIRFVSVTDQTCRGSVSGFMLLYSTVITRPQCKRFSDFAKMTPIRRSRDFLLPRGLPVSENFPLFSALLTLLKSLSVKTTQS